MNKRQNLTTGILLMAAIVVVVNVFSYFYFFRLDLTRDRRYTLSSSTKDILSSLKKPVTVTAFYSENSIPLITRAKSDLKDLLIEYAARSGNKVVFNFINPNKSDSLEAIAQKNGVNPFPLQVRDKDEMKNVKVYLGAVVKMGDKTEVLPFIDPGSSLEYLLSNAIKKISIDKKDPIGVLEGNDESALNEMMQMASSVNSLHALQEVKLDDATPIPAQYKTIAIVNPKDSFRAGQLNQLDAFLARGGRLLIAYNGLDPDLRSGTGNLDHIGFSQWLIGKGIMLDNKYLVDHTCGYVGQNLNGQTIQIPFPYLPMINSFSNHPISKDLHEVMLPFATDIKFVGDSTKEKFTPLAFSSNYTGLMTPPVKFELNHNWTQREFPYSGLTVAAAITGVGGSSDSRIVIIANGDFIVNGSGKQARKVEEDNVNLFSNSIDWLADNTGLIELRGKVVTYNPIKDVSDRMKLFLKYLNFSLPILLVILYGIIRMQVKKVIRKKRMEEIL